MTTTNRLFYTVSKRYIQAGTTFKIDVKILLADDCKNNICDWSITADIYEQRKNGRFVWCAGGCCHEEILKRFPQFKMFVDLHLSNHYGAPMYPVENGFYHITNSSKETAINYLRITETEYNLLYQAEDKQYFKYLLYTLGIVERWKRESNEALKKLEELTGQTWENPYKPENERFVWCAGGCCHEEILKRFPQFKMFVDLHLSNHYGAPMYPVENGFYHITNSSKETAINYLRITETEYNLLYQAEDKQYFKYLLYTLGIVERWKRESNEALKKLEELTGQTWENPYKPENERFTLKLTDEERTTITNRINDGYYRPEAVQARKDEEKRKAYEKKRAEIINNCEKKQEKAENEKRVMLAVLDAGLSVSNVIYYDHSNELVFNWRDHETKVTENDFNKFVSSVNRSLLPVGITFKMK